MVLYSFNGQAEKMGSTIMCRRNFWRYGNEYEPDSLCRIIGGAHIPVFPGQTRAITISYNDLPFAFVVFLIALPWILDTSLFDSVQIVKRFTEMDSIYNRVAVYATALNMMIHHPILGVGFGASAFANHLMEYITSVGSVSPQYASNLGAPHNEYFNIGTHAGFTGLMLFIFVLVFTFRNLRLVENAPSLPDHVRYAAQYVRVIMLIYCVSILFVDAGPFAYLGTLIFFLAGFMVSFLEGKNKPDGLLTISVNKNPNASFGWRGSR